jgi:hypothetical protein
MTGSGADLFVEFQPWKPTDQPLAAVLNASTTPPSETTTTTLATIHRQFLKGLSEGNSDFLVSERDSGVLITFGLGAPRMPMVRFIGKIRVYRSWSPRGPKLVAISTPAYRHLRTGPITATLRQRLPGIDRPLW